jgi:hypothetical protein
MTGRKPATRNGATKSGKQLKLKKWTLKDLAPAKGGAVRGGRGGTTVIDTLGQALNTIARTA